jgi:hypothetical protein
MVRITNKQNKLAILTRVSGSSEHLDVERVLLRRRHLRIATVAADTDAVHARQRHIRLRRLSFHALSLECNVDRMRFVCARVRILNAN